MPKISSRKNLTDLIVKRAKPRAVRFEMPDNGCLGLRLIVQPSGAKSWAVRTRINGKSVKLTLGPVALDAIDLKAVRDDARAAIQAAQRGERPEATQKRLLLTAPVSVRAGVAFPASVPLHSPTFVDQPGSVGAVWNEYLAKHLAITAKGGIKGGTYRRYKGVFGDTARTNLDDKRPLPLWRSRPINEISKRDCLEVLDAAHLRGPEARNSTIVVLSSFFNWAVERDHLVSNPVTGQSKTEDDGRERYLEDNEIKIFWTGCGALGRENDKAGSVMGPLFQMLLLTGQRRTEVAAMRFSQIKGRYWTVPGERTKNGKPHPVYLSDLALACLAKLPRLVDENGASSDFVFTTSGSSHSSGYSKAKAALDKLTPGLTHYTLHDLRRSFSTGCARIGIPESIADRCLNHGKKKKRKGVTAAARIYNRHEYASEKQEAWTRWSDHVTQLLTDRHADGLQTKLVPSDNLTVLALTDDNKS